MLISRKIKFAEQCTTCRNQNCSSRVDNICKQYKDGQYCLCLIFAPAEETTCKYYIDINALIEEVPKRARKKKE